MTPQDDRTPDLPDEDVSRGTADTGDPDRDELELEKRQLRLARIDPDGFEVLYRKYHPRIFRWMVLTLQDRDLARNLTDETFSRAVEGLDRFHWRGVKLGAWLFRIAYNVVGEHFRRSRVRSERFTLDGATYELDYWWLETDTVGRIKYFRWSPDR